ncbi:unnamed protein product [Amoebophrya sp. A25]|nr:unnamed protein product [Amoebophrya sp. A25]|eukprot:GSA25T00016280001.1
MSVPEDYIRKQDYRNPATRGVYPRRHAFLDHIEKGCYQSTYRQDIGGFFDLKKSQEKTKKLMAKRAEKWAGAAKDIDMSLETLDRFAVKGDAKLNKTKSEPRLNSEYRDKMRGRQMGFS